MKPINRLKGSTGGGFGSANKTAYEGTADAMPLVCYDQAAEEHG